MARLFKKYAGLIFIGISLTILLLLPHIKEGFYQVAVAGSSVPAGTTCLSGSTLFEVPVGSGKWKCYTNCPSGEAFYRVGKGQGYSTATPDIKCGPKCEQTLVYGYTDGTVTSSDPDKLLCINGTCPSGSAFDYGASVTKGENIQTNCYSNCASGQIPLQKAEGGIDAAGKSPPFDATWCSNPPVKSTNSAMGVISYAEMVNVTNATLVTVSYPSLGDPNYVSPILRVWGDTSDPSIAMPATNTVGEGLALGTAEFKLPLANYWGIDASRGLNWFPSTKITNPNTSYAALKPTSIPILTTVQVDGTIRINNPRLEYLFHATDAAYKYITAQSALSNGTVRNMNLIERTSKPATIATSGAVTPIELRSTSNQPATTGDKTTSQLGMAYDAYGSTGSSGSRAPIGSGGVTNVIASVPISSAACFAEAGSYCPAATGASATCPIGNYCLGGTNGQKTACDPATACSTTGIKSKPYDTGMPSWAWWPIGGGIAIVVIGGTFWWATSKSE
jgi:hypothetical protein